MPNSSWPALPVTEAEEAARAEAGWGAVNLPELHRLLWAAQRRHCTDLIALVKVSRQPRTEFDGGRKFICAPRRWLAQMHKVCELVKATLEDNKAPVVGLLVGSG